MNEPSKLARPRRPHKLRPSLSDLPRACAMAVALGLLALLTACGERTPMLNSERIEAAYGSYGIEVLEANDSERIANLYSVKDGQRTMRTYAEVRFAAPVDEALRKEHALVLAGESIGEVFKSRGWTVSKRDLRIGSYLLDESDRRIAALMRIDIPREVALHEYALVVGRSGFETEYALITERHHPDYLTQSDLEAIYGQAPKTAK